MDKLSWILILGLLIHWVIWISKEINWKSSKTYLIMVWILVLTLVNKYGDEDIKFLIGGGSIGYLFWLLIKHIALKPNQSHNK